MPDIVMFTKPGCPFCWMLRSKLLVTRIDVDVVDISDDDRAAELVRSVNGGNELTPTLKIGDRYLSNPSLRDIKAAIRAVERADH